MYSEQEIKDAGLDDFRVFLYEVWAFLDLPKPTPVQLDIAYNLQHASDRFILEAFRGVGKSFITVAFVLWCLLLNPQIKVEVVSANETLANDFTKFCRQIIGGMELLQHLVPKAGQRDSGEAFDVGPATPDKSPSVKSVGITGQLTGSRADIIVADDIEVPKNSYTHLLRERLAKLVTEFAAVIKPNGRIIYLGTPQTEQSLYPTLETKGYTARIWTAEIPKQPDKYKGRLADFVTRRIEAGWKPGTPIEPLRFDEEELVKRSLEYGRAGYQLQFMLDTSLSDIERRPLKCRDLMVSDVDAELGRVRVVYGTNRETVLENLSCGGLDGDLWRAPAWFSPEMTKFQGTVMAIDPSGMGKDETAYAIVRYLAGTLYLVAVGGFTDGFAPETLKAIAAKAARHRVNYIIAEENYGGGMFNNLLKPYLNELKAGSFDEEWDGWSKGQKEMRILDVLEPLVQNHMLIVDRRVIEDDLLIQEATPKYSFIYQLTRMERQKNAIPHDDRVEAVAMACSYWTHLMDRDRDKQLDKHKQELLDAELRKFQDHAFGRKKSRLSYAKIGRR